MPRYCSCLTEVLRFQFQSKIVSSELFTKYNKVVLIKQYINATSCKYLLREVVFIIVAVQRGLEAIKHELKHKGYEVVELETYNYPIDAIIYEGSLMQISHISSNNMPIEMRVDGRTNYGVFMINSTGKSIDQIERMLKTRCYSPLF
ncbi:MAG: YkuS family protein [Clostridia bacterium]|nr:YkuS family protein [Clostridia bacterium]